MLSSKTIQTAISGAHSKGSSARSGANKDILTYSLCSGGRCSDEYYQTVAAFADQWLKGAQEVVGDVVSDFQAYCRSTGLPIRSFAECTFELLALGVLLRAHGKEAKATPYWKIWLLTGLLKMQARFPRLERVIKTARGLVGGFGKPDINAEAEGVDIGRLADWLRAQGEPTQAGRLLAWEEYLSTIEGSRQAATAKEQPSEGGIQRCLRLADNFAEESAKVLGRYTEGVAHFLAEAAPRYHWRYDAGLVSRSPLEYHLGMLGTELLNRAYRQRFLSAQHKLVIVPPCMRALPEGKCQAMDTSLGAQCRGCTSYCQVHQLTKLGEKQGFDVRSIPDDKLRSICLASGKAGGEIGVVGVSCALTNWSGGWEADTLGLSAQGVLLDYAGCRNHWHKRGIPTEANLKKLVKVLGVT